MDGAHTVVAAVQNLAGSKVGQLHVHVLVQQNVLWLEVSANRISVSERREGGTAQVRGLPVDDPALVHVLEAQKDFRHIETGANLVKTVQLADPREEIPLGAVFQYKIWRPTPFVRE
jgi:hypothetical protein